MPIVIEKEGKTVSEATISACEELGVARTDIEVEVLQEGSKGVLGIGSKMARVRVTVSTPKMSEKGLRAKKTLEDLLKYFLNSYAVLLEETPDRVKLVIKSAEEKGLIIGRRGDMLSSLEYMVGKISSKASEEGRDKRVVIDVDGYQKRRERTVEKIVREAARKAKKFGRPSYLENMPPHERRIAYTVLKKIHGVKVETKEVNDGKTIIVVPTRGGGKPEETRPEE
ncbi:MAG: Jag N-terminal domain-containing protein [Candidatus Dadabacteria bacterium]|nr:Jag N-terminal domain-containing protein [Candidatus Dadabacteria bacterium]